MLSIFHKLMVFHLLWEIKSDRDMVQVFWCGDWVLLGESQGEGLEGHIQGEDRLYSRNIILNILTPDI